MSAGYHSVDLSRFALRPGEGHRLDLDVDPGGLDLAGQKYAVRSGTVPARLDLSRTAAGYAVRMRFTTDADVALEIDAREVDQPRTADEELTSPYITDDELDLARWAHDALALAMPIQLL